MHRCELCSKDFPQRRHLRLHNARTHTPKSEWKYKCEICAKVFADSEILERHMKNHSSKRPLFMCSYEGCKREFFSQFGRDKHFSTCHDLLNATQSLKLNSNKFKEYKCNVEGCDFTCSKHHLLSQHSFDHTGVMPFKCGNCDKRFKTLNHKTRHEKVHNGYKCEKCTQLFLTWTELLSHKAINHAKEFKCTNCDKIYYTASKLKQHSVSHEKEREIFKCPECERTFTRKHGLKMHVTVFHKGIREFKCPNDECNKVYAHRHSLNKHIRNCHRPGGPKGRKVRKDKIDIASRIIGYHSEQFMHESETKNKI